MKKFLTIICMFLITSCIWQEDNKPRSAINMSENAKLRAKIKSIVENGLNFSLAKSAIAKNPFLDSIAYKTTDKAGALRYLNVEKVDYEGSDNYEALREAMMNSECIGWVLPDSEQEMWIIAGILWDIEGKTKYFEIWYFRP